MTQMSFATIEACSLCGSDTAERVMALVEWKEPVGNSIWSFVPRCVDRPPCRERVELVVGEPWPVNDRTPAPRRPRTEDPAADDAPSVPDQSPALEEAGSWLA